MTPIRTLVILVICLFLTACAPSRSGKVYSRDQARTAHSVEMGTVERVEDVQIEGTKTPIGTVAGAATGGIIGSTIGGGSGRAVATVLGAVVGGVAGSAVEEGITRKAGFEITVKLDSGRSLVVVQEADEEFYVGDRVRIVEGGDGTTRVRH